MIEGWALVSGGDGKCPQVRLWAQVCGRRRHRSWPEELKREIVAASLEPGSSVSVVARRYDVNANQVFAWRKRYREPVSTAGSSATGAGDGDAGSAVRARTGVDERVDRN